jgi:hypothetical protein
VGSGIVYLLMGAAMAAQPTSAEQEAAAKAQTAYWQQMEAAAKARTAAIEAENAELKASFGTVAGQDTVKGEAEAAEGAGQPETMMLVADVARSAASEIAAQVNTSWPKDANNQPLPRTALLLVTSADDLSLSALHLYDFQKDQVKTLLETGEKVLDDALKGPTKGATGPGIAMSPITVAGLGLDAAAKLGSYFLSDYKFGKVEVVSPDNMMAFAVAQALSPGMAVYIPRYLTDDKVSDVLADVIELGPVHQRVSRKAGRARALAAKSDPGRAAELNAAAEFGDAAAKSFQDFVAALIAASGSEPMVEKILRQKVIQEKLEGNTPILLVTDKNAGAYYTKRNLWTFLGGPPLYTTGAVAVSYALLHPADRRILASGTVGKYAGYHSIRAVDRAYRPPAR